MKWKRYEFDRVGYLSIPGLLTDEQVACLAGAVDALEEEASERAALPPRRMSPTGHLEYHHNAERGYYASGAREPGNTLIIEDFFNADPTFDMLLDHAPTMAYINAIVQERPTVNNSEIRIRYPGNQTGTHMGGQVSVKHAYAFNRTGINCMMVRMIYFVHDVGPDDGPFSVVPATHKSNLPVPYEGRNPDEEPGMTGLPARAGRRHSVHRKSAPRRPDQPVGPDAQDSPYRVRPVLDEVAEYRHNGRRPLHPAADLCPVFAATAPALPGLAGIRSRARRSGKAERARFVMLAIDRVELAGIPSLIIREERLEKAPAVIHYHGWTGDKGGLENLDQSLVQLASAGFCVVAPDCFEHGERRTDAWFRAAVQRLGLRLSGDGPDQAGGAGTLRRSTMALSFVSPDRTAGMRDVDGRPDRADGLRRKQGICLDGLDRGSLKFLPGGRMVPTGPAGHLVRRMVRRIRDPAASGSASCR